MCHSHSAQTNLLFIFIVFISISHLPPDTSDSLCTTTDCVCTDRQANDGEERLVPIHADGDGHCLVHALSRALTGRELFWHPLRMNLQQHFTENMQQYQVRMTKE